MHHDETNENCMSVSVTGCGKELRIVLEEVFDSAEERYLHHIFSYLVHTKSLEKQKKIYHIKQRI